jgi:peptidoglycan/LPS O-acetylase OafA/YrhL
MVSVIEGKKSDVGIVTLLQGKSEMLYLQMSHPMNTPTSTKAGNSAHITAFDTVRGLAALSVVFSHYIGSYGWPTKSAVIRQAWTYSPLHIVWDGFAAVSLFYVLSGLVLSIKYFRDTKHPDLSNFSLSQYLTSRVFRIWPPYLFIFLLSYGLRRWVGFFDGATVPPANPWLFSTWDASIPFLQLVREGFLLQPGDYFLVPQGWTLPIELGISFLVPAGILLASLNMGWLAFFTLLMIGPLGANYYVFHFAVGILLAKNHEEIRAWLGPRRSWKIVVLLMGIILYTFRYTLPFYLSWDLPTSIPWIVTGIGSCFLLMVVIASERARAFLSFSWLKSMGRISYSIYLLHFLVIIMLTPRALQLINIPGTALPFAWWFGLAFTVMTTIGLASLSHRWVELPSIAFGKSLPKRFEAWKMRRSQSARSIKGE